MKRSNKKRLFGNFVQRTIGHRVATTTAYTARGLMARYLTSN